MSFKMYPLNPSQEQLGLINAVNTAPKALLHLCIDRSGWNTPTELNSAFMRLQGETPVWEISKNYAYTMASAKPLEAGTMVVSDTFPEVGITDKGTHVGVPVAAHLLMLGDVFGVKQTLLVGESVTRDDGNSPVELRYRAARFLATAVTEQPFTNKDLANAIDCSTSAASTIITEFTSDGVGFLETDPSSKPIRNTYAKYEVVSDVTPEFTDDDPLLGLVVEALQECVGQTIDARTIAQKLGYNVKYAGKDIANYLEQIQKSGQLEVAVGSLDRSRLLRVTNRGANAATSLLSVYSAIDNPSAGFKRRGEKLAEAIRKDDEMVKRIIARTPAKRGQKKLGTDAQIREIPAAEHVAGLLTDKLASTKDIQTQLGTSRTATARVLAEAHRLGLAVRARHGREFVWAKA